MRHQEQLDALGGNFTSLQDFGYNKYPVQHSVLSGFNMCELLPVGYQDIPIGGSVENDIDMFVRSSPLTDPAFLEANLSIAHYFVSYQAIDPFYRIRCGKFTGVSTAVQVPHFVFRFVKANNEEWSPNNVQHVCSRLNELFGPGSLLDHLGFSLKKITSSNFTANNGQFVIPAYPIFAYKAITDAHFRSSRIFDVEEYRTFFLKVFTTPEEASFGIQIKLTPNSPTPTGSLQFYSLDGSANPIMSNVLKLFQKNPTQWEPDYFTTSRRTATGPQVSIQNVATVNALLDSMLYQKVADMLNVGGFSYNDFARILYGVSPGDEINQRPIFLSGASTPLNVSAVTSTAATESTPLADQAGNVTAYVNRGNGFSRRFECGGIYMPIYYIRPETFLSENVPARFTITQLAGYLIPSLADLTADGIKTTEFNTGTINQYASTSAATLGYKDRYEEYRTLPNRTVGSMRTTRTSWWIPRTFNGAPIQGKEFMLQTPVSYNPWVVTDPSEEHFFARVNMKMSLTLPLPRFAHTWIW